MPYNTRRKSLSLPSLGIHIPVTHAARAAAAASGSTSPKNTARRSSSSSSASSAVRSESPETHPSKRIKRSRADSSSSDAPPAEQTPPPSPTPATSVDSSESAVAPNKIDLDAIHDDIVEAVIVQLQSTGNRPHLVKELETVLAQQLTSVQQSANPCAIISSRLASFLKRSSWSELAPCPLAKELESVHPRRTYYFLTTSIQSPSSSFPKLQTTHIPFLLDVEDESSETELGRLRGHMAKQNPQSKAFIEDLQDKPGTNVLEEDVLVVFTSPLHHYISTNFYSFTMANDRRTAPTWNYSAVQAYGRARIYHDSGDPETTEYLMTQLGDLATFGERGIMGYSGEEGSPTPWKIEDAPTSYLERLRKNIIGVEITLTHLEGKVKMSQELKEADREGVISGLEGLGTEDGQRMARLVRERAEAKMREKQKAVEAEA